MVLSFYNFKDIEATVNREVEGQVCRCELLDVANMLRQVKSLCDWYDIIGKEKAELIEEEDRITYLFWTYEITIIFMKKLLIVY